MFHRIDQNSVLDKYKSHIYKNHQVYMFLRFCMDLDRKDLYQQNTLTNVQIYNNILLRINFCS